MFRILSFLAVLLAIACVAGNSHAAKKKTPPTPPKPIYEAPMTVAIVRSSDPQCEPDCPEWISAEGEIVAGTPRKFRQVFKQMGRKKLPIVMRSPGGSGLAAVEIGRMIRQRQLDVAIGATIFTGCASNENNCKLPKEQNGIYRGVATGFGGFCNSACPLILAGGITRLASIETRVGVHKPKIESFRERIYFRETYRIVNGKKKVIKRVETGRKRLKGPTSFEYSKSLKKKLKGYYAEMGVDPAILDDSEKAAFNDMFTLRGERLDALKLRTSRLNVGSLTDWIICRREPKAGNCVEGQIPDSQTR